MHNFLIKKKGKHLTTKYGLFRLHTQNTVLYQIFSPGPLSFFFQKKNWTQSCHGESSILNWPLSSLSLLLSGWLRSWRTVWMHCQMMLFERVVGSRCCFLDAAEAVPLQIKLMVNAFAAMLSHLRSSTWKQTWRYALSDSEVQRRQLTEGKVRSSHARTF